MAKEVRLSREEAIPQLVKAEQAALMKEIEDAPEILSTYLTGGFKGYANMNNHNLVLQYWEHFEEELIITDEDIIYEDVNDVAIRVTNRLIEMGYVPDCTDTDDETEFEVQDMISEVILESELI